MVCRKFETSRRREDLTFKHHREVAALPPDEAEALLDWCEETPNPRSTRELRGEVHRRRRVTTDMIRAARELLRWRQEKLAERAGLAVSPLRLWEGKSGELAAPPETRARIIAALQGAGVEFLENGVRLIL